MEREAAGVGDRVAGDRGVDPAPWRTRQRAPPQVSLLNTLMAPAGLFQLRIWLLVMAARISDRVAAETEMPTVPPESGVAALPMTLLLMVARVSWVAVEKRPPTSDRVSPPSR